MFRSLFSAACAAALALALLTLSFSAQAVTIINTFDTDAQGWTGIPGEGALSYFGTGGNPGGHVRVTDIGVGGPLGSGAIAGPAFLGDLSALDGGLLSVDLATFVGSGPTFAIFGTVRITGAGLEALFDLATTAPGSGSWESYSAPLSASAWGVSDADWAAILADVTEIAISTDAFNGNDTIGIDNFSLATVTNAIPEPRGLVLLLVGLLVFASSARKRGWSLPRT